MMRTVAGLSALLLVGMLLGASMLVYAAYILIAAFWICRKLSHNWTHSLSAARTISAEEVEVGEKVGVQIRLQNASKLPIVWVLVEDLLPSAAVRGRHIALQLDGQPIRVTSIPASGSRIVAYRLTAVRRGYFQVGPVVAETGDLLGLNRRFRRVTGASYLTVLPKLIPLEGYEVASRRPVGEFKVSYRLLEDPTLISGIRAYRSGDPLRSVHWRATARTGELQCKQYEPTSVAGATIVVDMHRETNPDEHEPIRTDLAVTAAASICHSLMQMQQQFGLISNGRDAVDRIASAADEEDNVDFQSLDGAKQSLRMRGASDRLRPVVVDCNRGPEHFQTIHRTLARLERTSGVPLEDMLLETQSRMPRDATVLVIVQNVTESAAMALGLLARQGYSVAAIVNNYEDEAVQTAVGRLLANRVAVYHLLDENSVPQICKEMILKY
ncbi:MAG: DUF58 domain-containing protein [Aureliella sp.]